MQHMQHVTTDNPSLQPIIDQFASMIPAMLTAAGILGFLGVLFRFLRILFAEDRQSYDDVYTEDLRHSNQHLKF